MPAKIDPGHIGGPQIIPNCVQVRLYWGMPDGRTATNVLHGQVAGGFVASAAQCQAILAALTSGGVWTALAAYIHTAGSLAQVGMVDMRAANNPVILSTVAGAAGTGAALPMAPQTALVVTLRSAKAGAGYRGRVYIPSWSSSAQGATQVALPAAVTALQAWVNGWPAIFAAQSITQAIANPARQAYTGTTGTLHAARAAGVTPVTSLIVRNGQWDTQRRRAGRT